MRRLLVLWALAGCGDAASATRPEQTVFGGDRPNELRVSAEHDFTAPAPLVLVLHGYGANGLVEAAYSGMLELVDARGVLILAPDGTTDAEGNLYWNAEHPGCELGGTDRPDDVAYLSGLVAEVSSVWKVDPRRVFLFGHSNGGFMAHRLACERPDLFAAIVTLAGTPAAEPTDCATGEPVSVLHIHGDVDDTVLYQGSTEVVGIPCPYAGAEETVARWASRDGCAATRTAGDRLDLVGNLAGAETRVERADACPAGLGVELWTIEGGGHIPVFAPGFHLEAWRFLESHPQP